MALSPQEFERRIRQMTGRQTFRVVPKHVPVFDDGGLEVGHETAMEIWDKDGYGQQYVCVSLKPEQLDNLHAVFIKQGDDNRRKGRQIELVRDRKKAAESVQAASDRLARIKAEAMAKDFQPIIADLANELGVNKTSAISHIMDTKNMSWDDAKKEYVRLQGEKE